ncbi:hypothetical protein [uncultured Aeromicrobium sp.]|uniref:hypothetical protein n=1 Tax=uncultured Aeromicrobium sp. TaxID=337820 RepID=UPI0025F85682|nr:hypothetical protein [uncultured Aeromicrobium sp.]
MSDSHTSHGFGRLLVAVYAVFALSASARSLYQLATHAEDAPFAYSLSALAALVYVVATYALGTNRQRLASWTIGFELVGVLAVGLLTLLDPELFPDATVWSLFGIQYAFVPLVLPLVGLWWVYRHRIAGQD